MKWRKVAIWSGIAALGVVTTVLIVHRMHRWRPRSLTVQGAVLRKDADARKEQPIANALVTVSDGETSASTQSDASGYFRIAFRGKVWPPQTTATLSFRHENYLPLNLELQTGLQSAVRKLYVAAMTPTAVQAEPVSGGKQSVISNIRIRYTINSESEENIGSAVKTFQVIGQGNVPCNRIAPCSPDGRWKAFSSSATLDAGQSNEFRNVRASCIAGPCPFTKIDASGFIQGGRTINVTALDWSSTATFLLEAEVFHSAINSSMRESYPVVYGRTLNFTLPPTQEGVSIEAELDGTAMVFPLGPELYLSWATCNARTNAEAEKSTVYQCELKPGYRF